jgi:hypothetical protein
MKSYVEHKTSLTPAEKLRVAVAVLADGIDQHKVAALMGVNPGRVGEFISKIRRLLEEDEDQDMLPNAVISAEEVRATIRAAEARAGMTLSGARISKNAQL